MNQQEREEALQRKREKAARYAADPDRFTVRGITLTVRSDSGTRLVVYDGKGWLCSCDFFLHFGTCSHTMAVFLILKDFVEPDTTAQDGNNG